jgi:4-amino-4-deoxy-L-arabinose transferase-like glycosyltransferase
MNRPTSQIDPELRSRTLMFGLAMLVLAALWFGNLNYRLLSEPDEGRYAEIPREMLATGDWLAPHLNDIQYLEKPPLQYWVTAALYRVLGVSPWVSRFYNSALGFLLVLLVWRVGRRLYDESAGRIAALILASSVLFYALGHVNTLDVGLTFWMNAAVFSLLAWDGERTRRWALWLAWALLGFAVLQKGLVGVVLPGFALTLYILIRREWSLIPRLCPIRGMLLVTAINLPWWWLMQQRNPGFFDWFFIHEHYTRFTTTEHGREQPWWYFTALLLIGTLPWVLLMMRGAVAAWRADKETADVGAQLDASGLTRAAPVLARSQLLLVWAGAIFLFYAPSGSKLAPYILPMLPPLALLAGRHLSRTPGPHSALVGSFALAAGVAVGLLALPSLRARLSPPAEQVVGYSQIAQWGFGAGVVLSMAVLQSLLRLKFSRDSLAARRERAVAILAIGMVAALAMLSNGTNAIETWRGAPQATVALRRTLTPDTAFYCVDTYPQTVIFALGQTCVTVRDHSELETQFDDGVRNHLDTIEEFTAAWRAAPKAAAVVDPSTWHSLMAQGLEAQVLFASTTMVVIARNP